jgi:hypothetical protein
MKSMRSLAAGSAAALLLVCFATSAAVAYQGQVVNQVIVTGPSGTISCDTPLTLTATVLDSHGLPVDNLAVVWTFGAGQVTGDQISATSTTTNASGVTTTTVTLACIAGNRTIVATAAPASGQLVISPEFVLSATASPVAHTAPPGAAATPPPGAAATPPPTLGSSSNDTIAGSASWWIVTALGISLLLLLIGVIWFRVRRRGFAGR